MLISADAVQHPSKKASRSTIILALDISPLKILLPYFVPCPFAQTAMTYINSREQRLYSPGHTPTAPLSLTGGCYCKKITYTIRLASSDEAQTTICHCQSCKKTFGSAFGVTVKVAVTAVRMTGGMVTVRLYLLPPRQICTFQRPPEAGLKARNARVRLTDAGAQV